jgi:hypothetical protein
MTRNTEAGAANTCECGHDFYTHTNNTGKCGAGSCRCQKFSPRPDAAPATEGELEWLRPLYDYVMRYDADNMSDRAGVALNELHRRLAKPSSTQPPATEGDARNSSTSISTPKTAVTSDSSSKSATSWEFMHEQPPAPAGEEIEAALSNERAYNEGWQEHIGDLLAAIRPFADLVSTTDGRIPVERLSFYNWHTLTKAYKAAKWALNGVNCKAPLGCDCPNCQEKYGPIHPGNVGKDLRSNPTGEYTNPRKA